MTNTMNFGQAIEALKQGKMTLPYIYMYTAQGDNVPWLASQTDMLSEDWVTIE